MYRILEFTTQHTTLTCTQTHTQSDFSNFLSVVGCFKAVVSPQPPSVFMSLYHTPTIQHRHTQTHIIHFFQSQYSSSCLYNWIFNESVGAAYSIQTGLRWLHTADGLFMPEQRDGCCSDNWPLKSSTLLKKQNMKTWGMTRTAGRGCRVWEKER